jgi:hypothetical protein
LLWISETDRLRNMDSTTLGPDGRPTDEFLRLMGPPANQIPAAVPVNVVLHRSDDLAIALLALQVYSTGLNFDLVVRTRTSAVRESLTDLLFERPRRTTEGRFLLGVELADGRRLSNVEPHGPESGAVLEARGGGGGERSARQSWWLAPLPPEGPVTFVLRCDALGVAETSTVVDGDVIRRAVADVVTLWPWGRPALMDDIPAPLPPDLPAGSWFSGG